MKACRSDDIIIGIPVHSSKKSHETTRDLPGQTDEIDVL